MALVVIKQYPYAPEAYIDRGLLDANGIMGYIQGEDAAGIYPGVAAFATITLAVDEADLQEAEKLLGIENEQ